MPGPVRPGRILAPQPEQPAQRRVEIQAVPSVGRVERLHLQLAQALQAVALEVDLAFADRHVAEFGPRLDVEHEQQPVHHAQAFQAEVAGVELILAAEEAFLRVGCLLPQLGGGFIAKQLNGFAQGVFQVLADAERVLCGRELDGHPFRCVAASHAPELGVQARSRSIMNPHR